MSTTATLAVADTDQLIREPEAAKRLGVTQSTLRIWRQRRQGPPVVKLGRAVRYSVSDLAAFIDARRVTFTAA